MYVYVFNCALYVFYIRYTSQTTHIYIISYIIYIILYILYIYPYIKIPISHYPIKSIVFHPKKHHFSPMMLGGHNSQRQALIAPGATGVVDPSWGQRPAESWISPTIVG